MSGSRPEFGFQHYLVSETIDLTLFNYEDLIWFPLGFRNYLYTIRDIPLYTLIYMVGLLVVITSTSPVSGLVWYLKRKSGHPMGNGHRILC